MRYHVEDWLYGETDCSPPEPNKRWLTIRDEEGEEVTVIVQRRTQAKRGWHVFDRRIASQKQAKALLIVNALNLRDELQRLITYQ